jgi:hypothetical protein
MWSGLLINEGWIMAEEADFRRGELVRVQAALTGVEPHLQAETLAQATAFGVTLVSGDEVETTLEPGAALGQLQEISVPDMGPPATGVVGLESAPIAFAGSLLSNGDLLIFSTPEGEKNRLSRWGLVVALGSVASLLGWAFPSRERKGRIQRTAGGGTERS